MNPLRRLLLLLACCGSLLAQAGGVLPLPNVTWYRSPEKNLQADIYLPLTGKNRPALLMVHGGGWSGGDKYEMVWLAYKLAERGIVCVSIDYTRVNPAKGIHYPAPYLDVKMAVEYMQKNAGKLKIDPQRIGILGGSAGAHLAAMAATEPKTPLRAAVMLWGPFDLQVSSDSLSERARELLRGLFGPSMNSQVLKEASPYWRIGPGIAAKWQLFHGDADPLVPVDQSRRMVAKLRANGYETFYTEYSGEGHGIRKLSNYGLTASQINNFLQYALAPLPVKSKP